jgi:cytochrome c oxidase subunit 1
MTAEASVSHAEHVDSPHGHHQMSFLRKYIFSTDHKIIGLQYLFTCLFLFLVGGVLALMVRWQIAYPFDPDHPFPILGKLLWPEGNGEMTPEFYPIAFTMHASVMIFLVIIPLLTGAFGNWLIPLMIGAKDMAFPFLNGLSYWVFFAGVIVLCTSFFAEGGAGAAGWTSYPPLSYVAADATPGQSLWIVGVILVGTASIMGSMNYITTIVNLRAPGMNLFRMPLSVWALFITAILQLFATPVLSSAMAMLMFDRSLGTSFFLPDGLMYNDQLLDIAGGGQVLLWQHLFWFYSHPAVYIMILPAMGFVSDVLAVWSRKPIFGYRPMVYSISAIAGLGFVVWGHHMFQSGMNPVLGTTFTISTIMIALPSAVKVFNWMGTLWRGNITFSPAMLWALAFVTMFTIGGLSGIFMASTPVDIFLHDTYFIVAHIHYVLFTGSMMGIFAGIYHWFPKMFGRHINQFWGYVHFWTTFIFMNGVFFPMHIIGMGGYPRRIADHSMYEYLHKYEGINIFMTWSAILLGLAQIPFIIIFFHGVLAGRKVEDDNPWKATTLEWSTASPPPHYNWPGDVPTVYHGPYEYSHPNTPEDHAIQWQPMKLAGASGGSSGSSNGGGEGNGSSS